LTVWRQACFLLDHSTFQPDHPLRKEDKLRLLTTILESRHSDLREQSLNRQGKGHFHVSGMGHEAMSRDPHD
jgi:TPP-dependent pyruvate/acetoin dehydrogenase alpha subunit